MLPTFFDFLTPLGIFLGVYLRNWFHSNTSSSFEDYIKQVDGERVDLKIDY